MLIFDRIFLIGMPGSGKSQLGMELSKVCRYPFYDLDIIIEKEEKMTIPEIFENKGEAYFRVLESRCLKKTTSENFIMATGGGTPCFFDNIHYLRKTGFVVYLDVPIVELKNRLENNNLEKRPKLSTTDLTKQLSSTLFERGKYYEKSHLSIVGSNITVSELFQSLKKEFSKC